jgi:hypothetical protein
MAKKRKGLSDYKDHDTEYSDAVWRPPSRVEQLEDLHDELKGCPREHLYAFNGDDLIRHVVGNRHHVTCDKIDQAVMENCDLIMHNHPNQTAPSLNDIKYQGQINAREQLVAVDAGWYRLRPKRMRFGEKDIESARDGLRRATAEYKQEKEEIAAARGEGATEDEIAELERKHSVRMWNNLGRMGFKCEFKSNLIGKKHKQL